MKIAVSSPLLPAAFLLIGLTAAVHAGAKGTSLNISHHDLAVTLRPDKHRLDGFDRITFEAAEKGRYYFYLGDFFEVRKARLDGHRIDPKRIEIDYPDEDEVAGLDPGAIEHPDNRVMFELPPVDAGEHILEIEYRGEVNDTLKVPDGSRSGIPSETNGIVDTSGTYLGGWSTGWYPDGLDVLARFSIRVTTPPGYESVTEGKLVRVERGKKKMVSDWEVSYPTRHVTLMAANYVVRHRDVDGITLMAYFFPSERALIDTYLDASAEYLGLYNKLIGPYPFSKFAVVENFFPSGFGMPSYTLLGRRIVRMPFIVKTSLGHEVVHNWWGNSVYPDYEAGNWCEGLATYFADYRYESQKGDSAAAVYRQDILIDYATHVSDTTDVPLSSFRSREDPVTGVVGYGKCTMVFHMLRNEIGEEKFYRAMRNFYRNNRFKVVDWEAIESANEEVCGRALDAFFDQWVFRPGAPLLTLNEVLLDEAAGEEPGYVLRVEIGNEGGFVLPHVPVEITGTDITRRIDVAVTGERAAFDWWLDERPLRLAVDPDFDIFRKLDPAEIPVTISRALADAAVVVLPSLASPEKTAAYRELANRLAGDEETRVALDSDLTPDSLVARAVFILGGKSENVAWRWIEAPPEVVFEDARIEIDGAAYTEPGHAAFAAFDNTLDPGRTVCAIGGNSADAVKKAGYKVIYYGKYSYVTFLDGNKQVAGVIPPPPGPLVFTFDPAEPGASGVE